MEVMDLNLTEVIIAICTIVVTWVLNKASNAIAKKAESEAQSSDTITLANAFTLLSNLCHDAVIYYNETVVWKLKEAAADGKITDEEGRKIAADALEHIVENAGPKLMETLNEYFGDVQKIILNMIEKYVAEEKAKVQPVAKEVE